MTWAIRSPDHLGDGVMAIPAIKELASLGIKRLIGPDWCRSLYPKFESVTPKEYWSNRSNQEENIILFKPSFGVAWRSRNHKKRVGLRGNRRGWLLTTPIDTQNEHRIAAYNRIAQHFGLKPTATPKLPFQAPRRIDVDKNDILLIVGTNSPQTVRWKYFQDLANQIGDHAVIAGGPGDEEAVARIGIAHKKLPTNLSINDFAAAAAKVQHVVGTDSGLTHLAAAARAWIERDPKTVTVIYASTDPERTGPINAHGMWAKRPPCWPCYAKKCSLGLACMELSPSTVMDQLP